MVAAVFQIFRTGKSLELIMASFQLLNELEQVLRYSTPVELLPVWTILLV